MTAFGVVIGVQVTLVAALLAWAFLHKDTD
jgi:hypothetical protein